jgi:hypothetical protein
MSIDDVTDLTPLVRYVASAAQTVFAYPFPIFDDADLVILVDDVEQTLTTDYTVDGAGDDLGGDVTFGSAMSGGEIVTIYRDTVIERTADFQQNGPIASVTTNDELDKIYIIAQELKAKIGRAIRFPFTAAQTSEAAELTPISNWFSKFLYIGSTGLLEAAATISGVVALTQSLIGQLLNPTGADEVALGITPTNHWYKKGNVDRYGTNAVPGTTDMSVAFQTAINYGRGTGKEVTYGETWPYLLTQPMNCTIAVGADVFGFTLRNVGQILGVTYNSPSYGSIIAKHTGHVFDCSGSEGINFENVTVSTHTSTYPKTCWFFARNASGGGSIHRLNFCRTYGKFSEAVVYNYGAEDDQYTGCQFFNAEGGATASVFRFTSLNNRSLSSSFLTIATGSQSTIGHEVHGGAFANVSHNAAADVFNFDAIRLFKIFGSHLICADLTGGGRAGFYVDTTNGPSDILYFDKVTLEVSSPAPPLYGFYAGDTAQTTGSWSFRDCNFPHVTKMIKTHANLTVSTVIIDNVTDSSVGSGGIDFAGTLSNSRVRNIVGSLTAGTFGENNLDYLNPVVQNASEANSTLRHSGASTGLKNYKLRSVSGQFILSAADDANAVYANAIQVLANGSRILKTQMLGDAVAVGNGVLNTTATDGFLYVPTCAGTPTGTPTGLTGYAPIVVNTTNNKLYFYSTGAWRDAGP